jgi:competence protein ComEC
MHFAIPVVSLVVVPLTLAGALLPLDWPLLLAHAVMSFCIQVLQWLGGLPFSTWQQHAPPVWTLPLALLGVLWMLLPRGFPLRWLGLAAFLPMFMLQPVHPEYGAMKVAVLDVGQGLSVVLQTATHTLLYDAGPRYSSQSDSGNQIVIPYLRGQGTSHLNGFIVSHNDSDHRGGMASVLAQLPVEWVASSLADDEPELVAHRHMRCYAGQSWEWDGVHFEMLYPGWNSYADSEIKDNNRSCVLRVTSKFGSLLIPGDIERRAEAILLETYHDKLAADVLIAPHHGSKTSSSAGFVAAVKPAIVVFTMGYLNRFNHPKQAVVERYMQNGSHIYRSDNDGAILLDFADSKAVAVTRWRYSQKHYGQDAHIPEPKVK